MRVTRCTLHYLSLGRADAPKKPAKGSWLPKNSRNTSSGLRNVKLNPGKSEGKSVGEPGEPDGERERERQRGGGEEERRREERRERLSKDRRCTLFD